ncbi:hypothetical protein GCM10010358_22210 [Streptomyces minutiscleroticus]|uniref:Extensin n=1 Tax=Streptomyces minutiscleroticus TaxID=68238 RepID=A0A918NFV0_9ACTN|nr:extensin [Streptomyces minutiscleroticus]GGX67426.1 hypothetical protein GCM10010358_22210 [Streptomyces minutiscleroticus]
MADEQDKWLNREAAERLLRGEPLECADAAVRARADRLAGTLRALAAGTPPTGPELPGEAAAVAAFRQARTGAAAERPHPAPGVRRRTDEACDMGVVHVAVPRRDRSGPSVWGRPVRLGLAAALAAGTIGGAAVAAGTGILPTPFDGERPGPAASVSAAVSPTGRPLLTPSPGASADGGPASPAPGGGTSGSVAPDAPSRDEARGSAAGPRSGSGAGPHDDEAGARRHGTASACRDVRDGKALGIERLRGLEEAANGAQHVRKYCKGLLKDAEQKGSDGRGGRDAGTPDRDGRGKGGENDAGDDEGTGDGDDEGADDGDASIRPGGVRTGDGHSRGGVRSAPTKPVTSRPHPPHPAGLPGTGTGSLPLPHPSPAS